MKFVGYVVAPFRVPVGWWNRIVVLIGTASCLTVSSAWPRVIDVVAWFVVYQLILSTVYLRAGMDAVNEILPEDFPEKVREAMEMDFNTRRVAVDDLAELCVKYGIPPEEVIPIIERGMGLRVEK